MGGRACVLYGAAEFSRDLDLALLPDPSNLDRLAAALAELDAEVIAVPPFDLKHLAEGLAVHFRCKQPEVAGQRRLDAEYWKPLRERIERLRRGRSSRP